MPLSVAFGAGKAPAFPGPKHCARAGWGSKGKDRNRDCCSTFCSPERCGKIHVAGALQLESPHARAAVPAVTVVSEESDPCGRMLTMLSQRAFPWPLAPVSVGGIDNAAQ